MQLQTCRCTTHGSVAAATAAATPELVKNTRHRWRNEEELQTQEEGEHREPASSLEPLLCQAFWRTGVWQLHVQLSEGGRELQHSFNRIQFFGQPPKNETLTKKSQRMSSCLWNWLAESAALNLFFFLLVFKQKLMRRERRMFNSLILILLSFSLLQNRWVACLLWRCTLTSWIWQSWLTCLTRNWLRFLLILTKRPTASRPQVTLDWSTNKLEKREEQSQEEHGQGLSGSYKFLFNSFKCNVE